MSGLHCESVRLAIGADPRHVPPELRQHLEGCADCRQFHAETLGLEARIEAALQIPLHRFRRPSAAPRRIALAASLLVGLLAGGGLWLLRPAPALAHEVVEHMREEPGSWTAQQALSRSQIDDVLQQAGLRFDTSLPVVYASPCIFRGHVTPHLVLLTEQGAVTVMLLPREPVPQRQEFAEEGYRGVLLPAGQGSVAVLARGAAVPADLEARVLNAIRWQ